MLESRHVIGLFLLMLVFSGVFFTLGYVMGRSQYDGQVRAASTNVRAPQVLLPKGATGKNNNGAHSGSSEPSSDVPSQPDSDWTFYNSAKSNTPDENLKPVATGSSKSPGVNSRGKSSKSLSAPAIPAGAYTLQVAALRRQSDALALAAHLQSKRFPAFVASPLADKFYRVQVGPFADLKSADAARKGLESAGFKAIVKH